MKLLRSTTTSTIAALLACSVFATQGVNASVNPPINGVGGVVKKNPGSGASRFTTDKDGSGSVELTQGSYSISLDQTSLLRAGAGLVKQADAKSTYNFNGDGTRLAVARDKNITVAAGADKGFENVANITVNSAKATVKFTVTWDTAVMKAGKPAGKIGHVTLIK